MAGAQADTNEVPPCVDGRMPDLDQPGSTTACTPHPRYDPAFPTDPAGARAWMRSHLGGKPDEFAPLKQVQELLSSYVLSPAARAAVYRVAGSVPGATLVPDAVDEQGRRGIGIRWTMPRGESYQLVFDRETYRPVGDTAAVVDRIGDRP